MSRTYTLTEEQLDFISFMKEGSAQYPELADRIKSCCGKTGDLQNNKDADSRSEKIFRHSPKRMIEFLSLFSRDDRFKWYTHKWDMSASFSIVEMKERQIADRRVLRNMAYPEVSGPVVNQATYNQVWNFINFDNNKPNDIYTWKNNKLEEIKEGLHSVYDLSKNDPEMPVEFLKLPDGHQFRDYVRMFKAVIEFRTDLNDDDRFSELVWKNINSGLPKDFEVIFEPRFDEIGYDLNVYCDVVGIIVALNTLCNWMTKHKARSSKVSVDLMSEEEYYILEITHHRSYFNNLEKLRHPSGDLENLRKRLFSVCDFSMEGDYMKDGQKHGSLIVPALDQNTEMSGNTLTACNITESDEEVGSVKYKLKIYKRQ